MKKKLIISILILFVLLVALIMYRANVARTTALQSEKAKNAAQEKHTSYDEPEALPDVFVIEIYKDAFKPNPLTVKMNQMEHISKNLPKRNQQHLL